MARKQNTTPKTVQNVGFSAAAMDKLAEIRKEVDNSPVFAPPAIEEVAQKEESMNNGTYLVQLKPYVNAEGKGFAYKPGSVVRKPSKDGKRLFLAHEYAEGETTFIELPTADYRRTPHLQTVWVDKDDKLVVIQTDTTLRESASGNMYTKAKFFVAKLLAQHHIRRPVHNETTMELQELWGTPIDLTTELGVYAALAKIKKDGTFFNFEKRPWSKNSGFFFYEPCDTAPYEKNLPGDDSIC